MPLGVDSKARTYEDFTLPAVAVLAAGEVRAVVAVAFGGDVEAAGLGASEHAHTDMVATTTRASSLHELDTAAFLRRHWLNSAADPDFILF